MNPLHLITEYPQASMAFGVGLGALGLYADKIPWSTFRSYIPSLPSSTPSTPTVDTSNPHYLVEGLIQWFTKKGDKTGVGAAIACGQHIYESEAIQ